MLLLQQMLILFIYMLLGYWCGKSGNIDHAKSKTISWLVIHIANPALLLSSAINGEQGIGLDKLAQAALLAVVMYAILLALAWIVPKMFAVPADEVGIYQLMTVFNNIGFMGFPVIAATYGDEALLYAAIFTVPFNILIYTIGIRMVRKKSDAPQRFEWKNVLNAGVVSGILAIALYLGRVPMPQVIKTAASGLGGLTGPLSMMAIGISLSEMRLRSLVEDRRLLLYTFAKLLVIPVIGTMIVVRVLDNDLLCHVCMIMLATPVASMAVMLAQEYDNNCETATKGVALTTALSVLTIPLVSAIVF